MSDKSNIHPLPADRRYWGHANLTIFSRRKAYPLPEAIRATGGELAARTVSDDQPSDQGFDRYFERGVVKPTSSSLA